MTGVSREVADFGGPAALPRRNGELVFEAPWEGRAFGIAAALEARGVYDWDEFRARLIDRIASGAPEPYYESWLAALEALAVARGLVTPADLETRAADYRELRRDPLMSSSQS
jgi:nitrile hydratase accessory protein